MTSASEDKSCLSKFNQVEGDIQNYITANLIHLQDHAYDAGYEAGQAALRSQPQPAEAVRAVVEGAKVVVDEWKKLNSIRVPTPVEYLTETGKPMLVDMQSYREFDLAMRDFSAALTALDAGAGKGR